MLRIAVGEGILKTSEFTVMVDEGIKFPLLDPGC